MSARTNRLWNLLRKCPTSTYSKQYASNAVCIYGDYGCYTTHLLCDLVDYLISITFKIIWASIKLIQDIPGTERVQPAHILQLLHLQFLLHFHPTESGNNRYSCSFLQSSFLEPEVLPNWRCHSPAGVSVLLQQPPSPPTWPGYPSSN